MKTWRKCDLFFGGTKGSNETCSKMWLENDNDEYTERSQDAKSILETVWECLKSPSNCCRILLRGAGSIMHSEKMSYIMEQRI